MNYQKIVNECETKSEAIIKIYGYDNGRSRKFFEELIKKGEINPSKLKKRPSKYETVTKNCPVCGTEFQTKNGHKREKQTCSYACSNSYFRSGNKNPNWNDDTYRTTCFLYHKKECVICGEDKIVDVHHFDGNHNNNIPENLIPLCPTHHQYWHSRYKSEIENRVVNYRNNFILNKKDH